MPRSSKVEMAVHRASGAEVINADEGQNNRATATRNRLLDAAETLFIERGIDQVSTSAIVTRAGQRNQSALQYHFGHRAGLIDALIRRRLLQLEARRSELLESSLADQPNPDIRGCCALLVSSPFLLCREQPDFCAALGLIGAHVLASDTHLFQYFEAEQLPSLQRVWRLIGSQLPTLPTSILKLRIENTQSMALLAISRRARRGDRFDGPDATLFLNHLIDQVTALLATPLSPATLAALKPE